MLFNSIEFVIFLPIVFILYWLVFAKNLKAQNVFVVMVSYLFYGWWDWRFLLLIAFTSFCSYYSGILIKRCRESKSEATARKKRIIAVSNIVINLAILCLFKYFNFFSENFFLLFHSLGYEFNALTLNVILPVGISFYTFQALSYTIDVYKQKLEPTKDIVSFFAYVSFFPQLVAGPIERATNLLPQFYKSRVFDYAKAVDGSRQILWGLFKKMVVADNCAIVVNDIFANYQDLSASTLVLGGVLFAFQIYGDFSGYSDIAIGTARLFGIDLMRNFHFPYFSRDIAEFWRRWHISLNTWFRDYIYIPLGGSKKGVAAAIRNTFIIFLLSGFWHGANWSFIVWGAFHALLFLPLLLLKKNRKHTDVVAFGRFLPNLREFLKMTLTFALVVVGWIIFRADNIGIAMDYLRRICNTSLISIPEITANKTATAYGLIGIIVITIVEWIYRYKNFGLDLYNNRMNTAGRFLFYLLIVLSIVYMSGSGQAFIYFQF